MSDIKSTDCDTRPVEEEGHGQEPTTMRAATPYLCALYVATAGHQGNLLGSDEQEIVLLIYVVIDMTTNAVSNVLNGFQSF